MLVVTQEHPLALTRDMCVILSSLVQNHWEHRAPTPGPSLVLPLPEEVSGHLLPLETVLKTTGYVSGLPHQPVKMWWEPSLLIHPTV